MSDITAVNTERENGVIAKLQTQFIPKNLGASQFIGCQHNILDLVLHHLMDFVFSTKLRLPSINLLKMF